VLLVFKEFKHSGHARIRANTRVFARSVNGASVGCEQNRNDMSALPQSSIISLLQLNYEHSFIRVDLKGNDMEGAEQ